MPPKSAPKGNKFESKVDLAVLSETGLLEICKKAKISLAPDSSRQDIVRALREAGFDKHIAESEQPSSALGGRLQLLEDTVAVLTSKIEDLMARLESLSALPLENLEKTVRSLEADVGSLKEKAESHPAGITGTAHTVSHTVENHTVRDNRTDNPVPSYAQVTHSNSNSASRMPKSNPYRYSMITHHRRTVQNRPPAPGKPEHVQSAERIARSSFFIGNLSLDCTAEDLVEYCKTKDVTVTRCHVFPLETKIRYIVLQARRNLKSRVKSLL